jgi:diguanylate cyclase (GGDEF)-like protein
VDTAARLGGDEFAVILEQLAAQEDGRRVAQKIVEAMRPPFAIGDRALKVTTSVGLAFYKGEDPIDGDAILKRADDALYLAKAAGRDNYQVAA